MQGSVLILNFGQFEDLLWTFGHQIFETILQFQWQHFFYVLTAQHEMIALVLDRFRLLREREFSVHVGKIQPLV